MKAINAPVRARTVWYNLDHAKIVGAQAAEKRINRRTERARLKDLLAQEVRDLAPVMADDRLDQLKFAEVVCADMIQRMKKDAPASVRQAYSSHCKPRAPKRVNVLTTNGMLLASCAL